jgi:hypothetical protein
MITSRLVNARLAAALNLFDTEQSPPDDRIAAVLEAVSQTRDGMFTGSELLDKLATALNCTFYEFDEAGNCSKPAVRTIEAEANARVGQWPANMFGK